MKIQHLILITLTTLIELKSPQKKQIAIKETSKNLALPLSETLTTESDTLTDSPSRDKFDDTQLTYNLPFNELVKLTPQPEKQMSIIEWKKQKQQKNASAKQL